MDWRTAYLEQAKSDYAMLLKLNRDEAPLCHRLHYLQMTTEKMAKGFLTRPRRITFMEGRMMRLSGSCAPRKTRPEFQTASRFTPVQPIHCLRWTVS